ncbi:endoglucanase Acf2 [Saccharothrix tamanrassetensis]|uniref:glucan endo-1,3-beta-D-glucosidase n=1 Tax=Saccharothrix tamanrassetensis TaxID=1051531 RepID=A0A841CPQ8_9PSEU|nr:glycosyl hydrolase [Saccharothrix tamanrassetensis]MBB5958344.1 endoglucanase Acf2 [Saccharothrix tamanrassetensis]
MRSIRLAVLALVAASVPFVLPAQAHGVPVGAGSYASARPAGASGPSDSAGASVAPKVTARMSGKPVPTNDWWSSLVFQRYPANPYSENLYAHPLTFHAAAQGLGVGYPTAPTVTPDGRFYEFMHRDDLFVGVSGLNAPRTQVDGWSDWTVSPLWTDGARTLRTTIGHGSPYVYAEASGGAARVAFNGPATVWSNTGGTVGVTVNGHDYALFAPGAWTVNGAEATASAAFFSVAVLPNRDALPLFQRYAFSFVTDTKVAWAYNAANAQLTATYTATTVARQGTQTGTLQALYRHQWLNSTDAVTSYRYASPRGEMRLREGASFTTRSTFNGVLPALPLSSQADRNRLRTEIDQELNAADPWKGATDTYWTGKALWRLAALARVANQIGYTPARDRLLNLVRDRLTDWLTASPGETERHFAYDATWGTLIGYRASYGSDRELNDHHFHYGYYVLAASVLAQHDPAWAADSRYGGMVKLLVKDANNYDRAETRFPFLRNFDAYAGHGWASGHAGFAHGNNEESSSEAMMFATAAVLFGQAVGDDALRDAGIYLHTTQENAIGQYWFDKDDAVFPASFGHDTLGIVWGAGGTYGTWWTANPEEIHGINMLPITGGSLYHAAWKADISSNVNELRAANGGPEVEWKDVILQFLALADPAQALAAYGSGLNPEDGDSRAHAYHWLTSLDTFGTPDPSVTATTPTHAVLAKNGARTYVAYNPASAAVTVTFSDGQTLAVPAASTAWRGPAGSGVDSGTGGVNPTTTTTTTTAPPVARDAFGTIEAESHDRQNGLSVEPTSDTGGGRNVSAVANGDWALYRGVDFGSRTGRQFVARVASGAATGVSGLVEVRVGSPTATPLGSFAIADTGGWQSWRTVPADITGLSGKHDVYLTFTSGQPSDFVNVNWITFSP